MSLPNYLLPSEQTYAQMRVEIDNMIASGASFESIKAAMAHSVAQVKEIQQDESIGQTLPDLRTQDNATGKAAGPSQSMAIDDFRLAQSQQEQKLGKRMDLLETKVDTVLDRLDRILASHHDKTQD